MGGCLLDTHAAIWFLMGDDKLSSTAQGIIEDDSNSVYMSVVSALPMKISCAMMCR
jgi:PIN domain nuclease of toxin-antitoxin system